MQGVGILLLVVSLGCGESTKTDTVTVTGTVTFEGAPVEFGKIRIEGVDLTTRPAEALIEKGTYQVEVVPGEKRILLEAYEPGPPDEKGVTTNVQLLPPAYNAETEITRTVSSDGDQVIDFQLTRSGATSP